LYGPADNVVLCSYSNNRTARVHHCIRYCCQPRREWVIMVTVTLRIIKEYGFVFIVIITITTGSYRTNPSRFAFRSKVSNVKSKKKCRFKVPRFGFIIFVPVIVPCCRERINNVLLRIRERARRIRHYFHQEIIGIRLSR